MGWPWRFVDLDEEARALRRETLDRYAAYSQLSALIPVLGFVGFQLARWAYLQICAKSGRGPAYSSLPTAPGSPSLKSRRRSPAGALEVRLGALKWWLGDEVFILGKYRGERDVWVFGGLWTAWLLLLCVLGTDGDYLHLTKRFGVVAAAQFPIQYLLALKFLNPFAFAFRVSHEQINRWHRLQGRVVYILLLLHVICYVNFFIQAGILMRRLFAPIVFAGVVSWIGINLMTATAIDLVRNFSYRLFFVVHLLVSFTLPPLLFYHAKPARVSMVAALAFIVLDIAVRKIKTINTEAAFEKIPGTNLIKVSAPIPQRSRADEFNSHPGSHVYISIPSAARPEASPTSSWIYDFCFNPFTVADVDETTGDLTIVARHRGGPMTAALARFAKSTQSLPPTPTMPNLDATSRSADRKIPLSIEGPYGAAKHFPNLAGPSFDRVLMVTGGVGATFLIPLYRAMLHDDPNAKVELIWAVRSPDEASWAVKEGASAHSDNILTDDRVHLFMTGDVVADDPGPTPAGGSTLAPSGSSSDDGAASGPGVELNALYRDRTRGRFSAMNNRRRPDLRKIVDDIFKHGSQERVAVLVCGPEEMARELRRYVGAWVQRGRSVWWHNEGFGW